jgi:hypothetical protein
MAEQISSKVEKGSLWFRNLSLGAAAVELAIVTVAPETAPLLNPLIILNLGQAAVAEVVRWSSKRAGKSMSATT